MPNEDQERRLASLAASRRYRAGLRDCRDAYDRIKSIAQKTQGRLSQETMTTQQKLILYEEMLSTILSVSGAYTRRQDSPESTEFEEDSEDIEEGRLSPLLMPAPLIGGTVQPQQTYLHDATTWQGAPADGGQAHRGAWDVALDDRSDIAWMNVAMQTSTMVDTYLPTVPGTMMHRGTQTTLGGFESGTPVARIAGLGWHTDESGATGQENQLGSSVPSSWR